MPAFYVWKHQRFPEAHLPGVVMFYLHDADIRLRDAEYRIAQEEAIDALISELYAGRRPEALPHAGCAFPVTWLVVGAVVALMAILR